MSAHKRLRRARATWKLRTDREPLENFKMQFYCLTLTGALAIYYILIVLSAISLVYY